MYWPDDSVFITGVAKVTKDAAINAMYGTFSLSLVVDVHSKIVHRMLSELIRLCCHSTTISYEGSQLDCVQVRSCSLGDE